jgi:hypothetical protein
MEQSLFETGSSYVPMLSKPDFVVDLIWTTAQAVQEDWGAETQVRHRFYSPSGLDRRRMTI